MRRIAIGLVLILLCGGTLVHAQRKPSSGGNRRPSSPTPSLSNMNLPSGRPGVRPTSRPTTRPVNPGFVSQPRPPQAGGRPGSGGNWSGGPGGSNRPGGGIGGGGNRPGGPGSGGIGGGSNRPGGGPESGTIGGGNRPGSGNRPGGGGPGMGGPGGGWTGGGGTRPIPGRPTTKPSPPITTLPYPNRPGQGNRPGRPDRPDWSGGGNRPGYPNRPDWKPDWSNNRPTYPGRPNYPNRPRPDRPDYVNNSNNWNFNQNNFTQNNNTWNNYNTVNNYGNGYGNNLPWQSCYGHHHNNWVRGYWNYAYSPTNWVSPGYANGWMYSGIDNYSFYNPYYSVASVATVPTYLNYSQPLQVPTSYDYTPDELSMQLAMAKFDEAREAFKRLDYRKALDKIDRAISFEANDPMLHQFRALVLFAMGNYSDAAAVVYNVLSVGPGWDWDTMRDLYPSEALYTAQLRKLEEYSRNRPKSADAQFLLAYHYLTCGHTDPALRKLNEVRQLMPKDQLSPQLITAIAQSTDPDTMQGREM